MTETSTHAEPLDPPVSIRDRRFHQVRLVLVGLWLVVTGAFLVTYERPTGIDDLYRAVEAGEVESVQVTGPVWDAGGDDYVVQEIDWQDGLVPRTTRAVAMVDTDLPPTGASGQRPPADVVDELRQLDRGLRVTRSDYSPPMTSFYGYPVPDWLAVLVFVALFTTLLLVTAGPKPWRATRWAWFWLIWVPLGGLAFTVLAGRTPGVQPARRRHRRLTGWWAFLLAGLLMRLLPEGPQT